MSKYYDLWTCREDVDYDEVKQMPESEIVYAGYSYEDYSGNALVVFRKDGKWYENNDSHCSCYGLESWEPEETSVEALRIRTHWPGLVEALDAATAADAVDPIAALKAEIREKLARMRVEAFAECSLADEVECLLSASLEQIERLEAENQTMPVAYAGPRSVQFWRTVGALPKPDSDKAYEIGCQIQELEAQLKDLLRAALASPADPK